MRDTCNWLCLCKVKSYCVRLRTSCQKKDTLLCIPFICLLLQRNPLSNQERIISPKSYNTKHYFLHYDTTTIMMTTKTSTLPFFVAALLLLALSSSSTMVTAFAPSIGNNVVSPSSLTSNNNNNNNNSSNKQTTRTTTTRIFAAPAKKSIVEAEDMYLELATKSEGVLEKPDVRLLKK